MPDPSGCGGLRERNDHGLRGAVHIDGAPRYRLLRRPDHWPTDLLVDPDRLELDRLAPRHVEGRQENREGCAAGIDRHLQSHGDQVAQIGRIGVDRARQETLGDGRVLIDECRKTGIGADCVVDFDTVPLQCELVCHGFSPLMTDLNLC